jgi:nitric oxide dioxygenase
MLSRQTIETVQATIPVLVAHGETLTRHFYRRMFTGDPGVRAFFNPAHQHTGGQQRALAAAICAYAQNIENPAALADAVEIIAQKHCSLGVLPEHYPVVGKHLLGSIKEVLGDAATDAILSAWGEAYGLLADVLIQREAEIYAQQQREHGWSGYGRFIVRSKRREGGNITSLYLARADGTPVAPFKPGQYVTVRVPAPAVESDSGAPATTMRNYSLSGPVGAPVYRISVKRELGPDAAVPAGYVSNYLHDEVEEGDIVEVAPPCGEFVLQEPPTVALAAPAAPATPLTAAAAPAEPLVLIAGGVGVTPVLSMLHAALRSEKYAGRDIWFIQGAVDGDAHAFRDEVQRLADLYPRLHVHVRYSNPVRADRERERFDSTGVVDAALIRELIEQPAGDFYFCGPKPMMAGLLNGLLAWGVEESRLHYEFFGPAQSLRETAQPAVA